MDADSLATRSLGRCIFRHQHKRRVHFGESANRSRFRGSPSAKSGACRRRRVPVRGLFAGISCLSGRRMVIRGRGLGPNRPSHLPGGRANDRQRAIRASCIFVAPENCVRLPRGLGRYADGVGRDRSGPQRIGSSAGCRFCSRNFHSGRIRRRTGRRNDFRRLAARNGPQLPVR